MLVRLRNAGKRPDVGVVLDVHCFYGHVRRIKLALTEVRAYGDLVRIKGIMH